MNGFVRKFAVFMPVLAGIMFGLAGVFARILVYEGFSIVTIIFARTSIASILMLIYILIMNPEWLKFKKENIVWILCCAVFGMLITNITFSTSAIRLSLGFAAVLLSLAPVYTLIISHFVFGEKISGRKISCVIMTILGCIMVSGVIGTETSLSIIGIVAGILAGISYGSFTVFSKLGYRDGLNSITITFYCMVANVILTAPGADYTAIIDYVKDEPGTAITVLLLNALLIAVFPYMLLTSSVKYLDPGKISILASSEPAAAMIFGWILFDETPTVITAAGMILTIAALALLCRKEPEPADKSEK